MDNESIEGDMNNMRKTKIVCTLGPATDDRELLKELMEARNECGKNKLFTW